MQLLRTALAVLPPLALVACDQPTPTAPPSNTAQLPAASVPGVAGPSAGGPPGSLVFYSARGGSLRLYTMDPDGANQQPLPHANDASSGNDLWPDISPDGHFVAFTSNRTGNNEIHVLNRLTGTVENVSNSPSDDSWPRWSPDGHRIAFHSNRDGNYNIFIVDVDAMGHGTDLHRVTSDAALDQWPDWSPDGQRLAFRRGTNVFAADADGPEQNVQQLTFTTSSAVINQMPAWAPDGRQIAFMSTRDGYPSVFLMSAAGETADDPAINLTPKNASDPASAWLSRAPAWSHGQRIYFMSFRPSTGGDVELFRMKSDGSRLERLTCSAGEDGGPRAAARAAQDPHPSHQSDGEGGCDS